MVRFGDDDFLVFGLVTIFFQQIQNIVTVGLECEAHNSDVKDEVRGKGRKMAELRGR